jgi:hypothetical protein
MSIKAAPGLVLAAASSRSAAVQVFPPPSWEAQTLSPPARRGEQGTPRAPRCSTG